MSTDRILLHIALAEDWNSRMNPDFYEPSSLAELGFVHLCRPAQLEGVANAFYGGRRGLLLLQVDPGGLDGGALRWEPPAPPDPTRVDPAPAGSLFPHLYGPLPVAAVRACRPFEAHADGRFHLPAELEER